jgi:hypothetical protein
MDLTKWKIFVYAFNAMEMQSSLLGTYRADTIQPKQSGAKYIAAIEQKGRNNVLY